MNYLPLCRRPASVSIAAALLALGLPISRAVAVDYTWSGGAGAQLWSTPGNWVGPVPNGLDPTANLIFGGSVGAAPAPGTSYVATNDILNTPFLLNQLTLQATDALPATSNLEQTLAGNPLRFTGTSAQIVQNGTAAFVINNAIQLTVPLTFDGPGSGANPNLSAVTLNGAISGTQDIVKNGTSTFRFGSLSGSDASANTWFGNLTINGGTVRFNNNARTAPTALRSNPVNFGGAAGAQITTLFKRIGAAANQDPDSSLRLGTLNGTAGLVEARRSTSLANAFAGGDIVITALVDGTYGGNIRNIDDSTVPAAEQEEADFVVRGIANQTLTGATLQLAKDVIVGRGATLTLRQNATLSGQASGAIVLSGGTFVLDNTANSLNRLRDAGGTGMETIGGGKFSLISHATAATSEVLSRLQLGSAGTNAQTDPGKPRSGALTINVTKTGTGAATLTFSTYLRDGITVAPVNTVDFTANDGTRVLGANDGTGISGNPRIIFTSTPVLFNSLIGNSDNSFNSGGVGWATVNGAHFASYDNNGVKAASTTPFNAVSNSTANQLLDIAGSMAGAVALSSLRIAPTAAGFSLSINGAGNLNTNALLLAGDTDYSIVNSGAGTGGLGVATGSVTSGAAASPRYVHVQRATLTVGVSVAPTGAAFNQPLVKAGKGTLALTSSSNSLSNARTVINEGTLRATPGSSLMNGVLELRGGILEIMGGTFARSLGTTAGTVNWSGVESQDRGSGGFAAFGSDAVVDLGTAGPSALAWEDTFFVNSGHALVFGSPTATHALTWVDNLNLTQVAPVLDAPAQNYNAREIRVVDNPNVTEDRAIFTGTIAGTVNNDLLKTGNGRLELTGTSTFQGATLVTDGTMVVNGSTQSSFLTHVRNLNAGGSATLAGKGTVGAVKVETGGIVAPGDTLAHSSILHTGELAMGSGAKLAIELGGTTAGGDGVTGYDQVDVTGAVRLAGSELVGSFLGSFLEQTQIGNLFFIIRNDGADAVEGTFVQGSTLAIGSAVFEIGYAGSFEGGTFDGGNDVVLRTLVPEPGVAALVLAAFPLLVGRRRRR